VFAGQPEGRHQHKATIVYQTLFHIPQRIAGVPVFGFGLLLALWAVLSMVWLFWLIRRQGLSGETLSYLPVILALGAIIAWVLPVLCDHQGLPIRGYGLMILLAVLSAVGLTIHRGKQLGISPETVVNLAFWLFVPGIIGARVFYVVEYWSEQYSPALRRGVLPLLAELVNISQGGLVVYGALMGVVVGMVLFVRRYRMNLLATCDLVAPGLVLALAIGRIGCLLNGCCFGAISHAPWAVSFPLGSPPYESQVLRRQSEGLVRLRLDDPNSGSALRWVWYSASEDSAAAGAGLRDGDRLKRIGQLNLLGPEATPESVYRLLAAARRSGEVLQVEVEPNRTLHVPSEALPLRSKPVHPTQLYSTIDAAILCLLLLAYAPYQRRHGELFALMLSVYGVSRFLIEILRTDEPKKFIFGTTIAQVISVAVLLCAAGLWAYIITSRRR